MNKVSIVIPCFNNYDTIIDTFNSVLNQSFRNYEIIIINDGSDEETSQILRSLKYENLLLIEQKNSGVVNARNIGIKASRSEFVLTLDADDTLEPSFLDEAMKVMENDSLIGVVTSNYKIFDKNGLLGMVNLDGKTELIDFLEKNRIPSNALYRKVCWEQVKGYDNLFDEGYEDWDFWLSVSANGWKFKILDKHLIQVQVREESRNRNAMLMDFKLKKILYNKHKKLYVENFNNFIDMHHNEIERLRQTIRKRDGSIEMRIGKILLSPFRQIKNLIKMTKI